MNIIKNFSSAWGASVMGLSAYTMTLYLLGFKGLAMAFAWFLVFWLAVVLTLWTLRALIFPRTLVEEYKHPIKVNFLPTVFIGLLVASSVFLTIFHWKTFAYVSWWISATFIFIFGILIGYDMFITDVIDFTHVNYSWLIPPVASIVVTLVGIPVATIYSSKAVAFLSLWFFGIGMFLFLFVGGFVFMRMISHQLPPCPMAPSFWIMLGPIGVGTLDLLILKKVEGFLGIPTGGVILWAIVFWGFGIWALSVSLMLTLHYHFKDKVPYGLGWWAYIFPLGAYTNATLKLYYLFQWKPLLWIGWALALLLTFFFIRTGIYTIIHTPKMLKGEQ